MTMLRKYGAATTIRLPHLNAAGDGYATDSDWTPASGDVLVSKDGGSPANIGTLPSYSNGRWAYTLTATEMQAAQVDVQIVDADGDLFDAFTIETYGNASAQFVVDFGDLLTKAEASSSLVPLLIEIAGDVAGLDGAAMRGTDNANTVAPLDAAGTRDALGLAAANLDTQLDGITAPTTEENAQAVWEYVIGASDAATLLAGAGSAGDPWLTELPGAYNEGTAGHTLGVNVPAIQAKTNLIGGGGAVTVINSLRNAGTIMETIRGDDHTAASPHGAYVWDAPVADWGDLTDATITFTSRRKSDDEAEIDGYADGFSVLNPNSSTQQVSLDLPAAQTGLLTPGVNNAELTNRFDVQVVRADGVAFTLARGDGKTGGHTIRRDSTRG